MDRQSRNNDSRMRRFRPSWRILALLVVVIWIGVAALCGLLKPISNGCVMTYMYPTYIPIAAPEGNPTSKYGLYLYHEGWKRIDFQEHMKQLSGVPVLFIPGNGGSYKQVRSLAAESDRAYQIGPLEQTFYQEAYSAIEKATNIVQHPKQYNYRLDWFAVDLEGEHSAMDGRILEEHAEYVVYAIHRILDQYKISRDAREREGAAVTGTLPKNVILVGHSMGGFVARAATVHPQLRKSAVETILTLSSPHQYPPVALQPSLGYYYERINNEWRMGYEATDGQMGHHVFSASLSHVLVVSISGGYHDYQVRTKLESLDGIVPSSHGFMISSTSMRNVWLSMEHQAILWCNQLVVQVSHTLLSVVDSRTGHPFSDTQKRLVMFTKMLHSAIPVSFNWKMQAQSSWTINDGFDEEKDSAGIQMQHLSNCPSNGQWSTDVLETDLHIETNTVTILAMDGRRRWLDLMKLGSNGRNHFIFVTNFIPCSGVRLHLWPDKGNSTSELPASSRALDVTSKMVQIPAGPAPRQIEPGSQTEQPPPSAIFQLTPKEMRGFRFLTISVAPRPMVSGRPPPAASMAVGQFFNPEAGKMELSPTSMLLSTYSHKEIFLEEDHPLAFNISFSISLGLLPVTLSLRTAGCGIKDYELIGEEAGDAEHSRLCKLRCFPPVALAWDSGSGLYVFPNLQTETLVVDSSPVLWGSSESDKTTLLLLVDSHCSYKISISVSITEAASRFLLVYSPRMVGFSVAVVLFALMQQEHAQPAPSLLKAVESNLKMPLPFLLLAIGPILACWMLSFVSSWPFPSIPSFITISVFCYMLANGFVVLLILATKLAFYVAAYLHVFFERRWKVLEGNFRFSFLHWSLNLFSSFFSSKVMRVVGAKPSVVLALAAVILTALLHPAFGLFILIVSHVLRCHSSLCNSLTASFCNIGRRDEPSDFESNGNCFDQQSSSKPGSPSKENSSSYSQAQEDRFNYQHGLLVLHLLAALMFVPSLVSWFQRMGMHHSFPRFIDVTLCTCLILHGTCSSEPSFGSSLPLPPILGQEVRFSTIYLLAGLYCYLCGLVMAPYKVFYAMAGIGAISFASQLVQSWTRTPRFGRSKHLHKR